MHIRREIELFLNRTDMAPTYFGRQVANDPRLVLDIRNGREVRSAMERKIRRFINGFDGNRWTADKDAQTALQQG